MLVKFKFGNYRSYQSIQNFSLIAGKIQQDIDRVYFPENLDLKVLKFAALYGANASGKTNFVRAIHFMKHLVLVGCAGILNQAFRLDEESLRADSYFEVQLLFGQELYSYGFEVNDKDEEFRSEWLTRIFPGKSSSVFELNYVDGKGMIGTGSLFDGDTRKRLETYKEDVLAKKNTTFLSFVSSLGKPLGGRGGELIRQCYEWFHTHLIVVSPDSENASWLLYPSEKLDQLGKLMKAFDMGISKIAKKKMSESDFLASHGKTLLDQIKADIAANKENSGLVAQVGLEYWVITKKDDSFSFEKLVFYHFDNDKEYFDIADESDGTNRVLRLIDILMTEKEDLTFFVDELDRCLHPQMTCEFVRAFLEKAKKNSNQLIVTTHESHLLDLDILRHDEVWFVNNEKGASSLYSLDSFNERFDRKIGKAYLNGRYDGVPHFKVLDLTK